MRIVYFVPGPISKSPLGPSELARREKFLSDQAFAGTEIAVRETTGGPASIESAAEECLAVPYILEAVPRLEQEGFDAAIIGCFDDPGLPAARELTPMPVIGPAQASCHLAAQLGDRFAILTVLDEVIPLLNRLMRTYGMESLLTEIRAVDVPVLELRSRPDTVLANLAREGKEALERGADTIILGCMTMGFLGVAEKLQSRLGVPVINPVLASLKAAESAVALGITHSRRAYPSPRKQVLTAVV